MPCVSPASGLRQLAEYLFIATRKAAQHRSVVFGFATLTADLMDMWGNESMSPRWDLSRRPMLFRRPLFHLVAGGIWPVVPRHGHITQRTISGMLNY